MIHSFDVEVATKYGVIEAILLSHLHFWVKKNEANEKHFHDGNYWTYNSRKAFQTLFPYVSDKTISRALKHLEDEGLVVEGNYNQSPYDKTLWYSLTKLGYSIGQNSNIDWTNREHRLDKMTNRSGQNVQPIPDIIPDNKTQIKNTDIYSAGTAQNSPKRFIKPTYEEVKAYCDERHNGIDPQYFLDRNESVGWVVGKNRTPMKDWKATIRTWERNNRKSATNTDNDFSEFLQGERR